MTELTRRHYSRTALAAALVASLLVPVMARPADAQTIPNPEQACPLTEGIVVNQDGTDWGTDFIRSDRDVQDARLGPVDVAIPAGRYRITVASYDDHTSPSIAPQPNERWYIQGYQGSGWEGSKLIFTSNITLDLPENTNTLTETLNADITIPEDVNKLWIRHAAYPDTTSTNSVHPVCASFGTALVQPDPGQPAEIVVLGGPGAVSDTVAGSLQACTTKDVTRIAGANRYATAAAISKAFFAAGADVAYVATGLDFPDALAGSAAAGANAGPILLVTQTSIPIETTRELQRLAPKQIVVLGGPGAVAESVATKLAAYAPVRRVAGPDRFATAAAVSADTFGPVSRVYVATGRNFPDALAGSPPAIVDGSPVLLVDSDRIPGTVKSELSRLSPSEIVVLGGPGAVSDAAVSELGAYGSTSRIAGTDRYSTAVRVSRSTFASSGLIFIATGENFPDALAGGPLAGLVDAPILLVGKSFAPQNTLGEIERLTGGSCS